MFQIVERYLHRRVGQRHSVLKEGGLRIYRVENEDEEGIYRGGGYSRAGMNDLNEDRHPHASSDPKLKAYIGSWGIPISGTDVAKWPRLRYGFSTKAQCRSWLHRKAWREGLVKAGYQLNVYEAKVFKRGTQQVIFDPDQAEKIGTLDLVTLKA